MFSDSASPAYRGHKARKRVANDKSKAKLEAFIIKFQAGKSNPSWSHLSRTI